MDGSNMMEGPDLTGSLRVRIGRLIVAKFKSNPEKIANWFEKYHAVRRAKLTRHYEIQRGRCAICQCQTWMRPDTGAEGTMATIEHLLPQSMGGTDHFDNLIMTCLSCNNRRGTRDIFEFYEEYQLHGIRKRTPVVKKSVDSDKGRRDVERQEAIASMALLFMMRPETADYALEAAEEWGAYVRLTREERNAIKARMIEAGEPMNGQLPVIEIQVEGELEAA